MKWKVTRSNGTSLTVEAEQILYASSDYVEFGSISQ